LIQINRLWSTKWFKTDKDICHFASGKAEVIWQHLPVNGLIKVKNIIALYDLVI